jgi:hypothetical protein
VDAVIGRGRFLAGAIVLVFAAVVAYGCLVMATLRV